MAEENLTLEVDTAASPTNDGDKPASPAMTPNSTIITPSNAQKLKSQLFELFKKADKDNTKLFTFDEFSSVIHDFLPNTKEDRVRAMFDTLDANHDQKVTYEEFLDDTNFNRFLEYCGFFQSEEKPESKDEEEEEEATKDKTDNADLDDTKEEEPKVGGVTINENENVYSDAEDNNNEDIHEKILSPQDASKLKEQLFELCKQGDIDKNELIDFNEFSTVINKFLPHTSEQRMHEMFETLDENGDGNISYVEFLKDSNFNKFLEYCGYSTFMYNENAPRINDDDRMQSVTQIAQSNLARSFSVRNAHDKQIILAQKEVIEKLNKWIIEEGKPSKERSEQLQIQMEVMQVENEKARLELDEIRKELQTLTEEKTTLKKDFDDIENHKKILNEKLKDTKDELAKAEEELEEYYNKDVEKESLNKQNTELKQENAALKQENTTILERNNKFEEKNNLLQTQLNERTQTIQGLEASANADQDAMKVMRESLEAANEELNEANEQIDDLREKLGLTQENDTYRPVASHFKQTIRMDDMAQMKSQGDTINQGLYEFGAVHDPSSSVGGGFHQGFADTTRTIDDYQMGHTAGLDTIRAWNGGGGGGGARPRGQSETERDGDLQATVYEYQAKQKEWEREKEDMQGEQARLNEELVQLKKQLDEERLSHELEVKNIMKMQNPNQKLIGDSGYNQNNNISNNNANDDEDEKSPLVGVNERKDKTIAKMDAAQPGCVCFGWAVW